MKRLLIALLLALAPALAAAQGFGIGGGPGGGSGSGTGTVNTTGCSSSRAIPVNNGTSGTSLTCTPATIGTDGSFYMPWTTAPASGTIDGAVYTLVGWDGGSGADPITYAVGQHYLRGLIYTPRYFVDSGSNPTFNDVGFQVYTTEGGGDHDDIFGFNYVSQVAESSYKASRSILPFSSFYSFENAQTNPLAVGFFAHFDNLGGTGTGTVNRLAGFYLDDTAPGYTGGTWAAGMTIDNAYGILIDNLQLAGMGATKWVAGAFGGPVLIEDNGSSASATVDNDGWLFWASSLTRDYNSMSYGLRWNQDAARAETRVSNDTILYDTYSSNVIKHAAVITDDKQQFCVTSSSGASGEICMEIDPTTTEGVKITGPSSYGGALSVAPSTGSANPNSIAIDENKNGQTCVGVADKLVLCDDSEGDSTQDWKFWIDNVGPYETSVAVKRTIQIPLGFCTADNAGTSLVRPDSDLGTAAGFACNNGTGHSAPVLQFLDASTNYAQAFLTLPTGFVAAKGLTLNLLWSTSATTGNVVWQAKTLCTGDGDAFSAPTFNSAATVTDAAKGSANLANSTSISLVTTGCDANDQLAIQFIRIPTDGSDTIAANAFILSASLDLSVLN